MHDQLTNTLPGPDFLEAVADTELANGNPVNADIYRQRAREWRQQIADYESLQARLASMQQAHDKLLQAARDTLAAA